MIRFNNEVLNSAILNNLGPMGSKMKRMLIARIQYH